MKKLYTLVVAVLITAISFAQSPDKMSYQAVVRDSGDALVTNQAVGMQISILQTTATGTAVYVETQTPTTNVNGLLTLEIGAGSVVSGDFTTIDWSADSYFIKTETDPTGGSSYTITGTSQLLSVPYALHAKTAGSVTETQTLANVIAIGNTADAQIKNVTDPTDAQGAATKAYVDALEAQIAALDTRITALEPATIGDFRDGGVVFWVDPTDNTHGLVCSIQDQSTGIQWYNGSDIVTGATGAAIGTGTTNTAVIITAQGAVQTNYAAGLAKAYGGGGFNDWFLPSKDELYEMYLNKAAIDASATANGGANFSNYYWSSTEVDSNYALDQNFGSGSQNYYSKNNTDFVRAVRAF
jgi:hypothetical protein